MNQRITLLCGAALGLSAVAIGAFGAHALKATLTATGRLETYELAVQYQFYHALAMLLVGSLMTQYGAAQRILEIILHKWEINPNNTLCQAVRERELVNESCCHET